MHFESNSLALVMVEQTIIWEARTSIEMFDGTKSKFKAWTEAIENVAQILGQNTIHTVFSKLIESPLSTAKRLKTKSPKLPWADLKSNHPCNILSFHLILMQAQFSPI